MDRLLPLRNALVPLQRNGTNARAADSYVMAFTQLGDKFLKQIGTVLVLASLLAAPAWAQQSAHVEDAKARPAKPGVKVTTASQKLFGTLGIASKSMEARENLEMALDQYENAGFDEAIMHAQMATEKDPNFALAYAVWSFVARRTVPVPEALQKAKALKTKCAGDECLLVQFLTGAQEANVIPAIAAMNDLLARHPKDKHILYLAGEWLFFQQDFERAAKLWTASLEVDPNFPPALNMLGYSYVEALGPDPQKAVGYLRRYADVLPDQPNPQDSLGEVLRMTGDDSGSLAHYAEALRISPTFTTSQYGRGDTYTMMGNYGTARSEYEKALKMANNPEDKLHVELQSALVHFWEGDSGTGRQELAALSTESGAQKNAAGQFEIDYARALLAPDAQSEQQILLGLENSFAASAPGMTEAQRNAALASVLREEVRVHAASNDAQAAQLALDKLAKLAADSRDLLVESYYESGLGFLSAAQGDFAKAAEQLAADLHAPLTVRQLVLVERKLGDTPAAEKALLRLKYLRTPTAEWYVATQVNRINPEGVTP
ncbi:MAG TPA: tetratricopeptide repeat protein [Candidatus Acidoferrum sp.]|nr:tetratricopeptide repeat protein [Candidatus Acidoferrum sp.]